VGAEPPTCFRDSEHTRPCRTRGRGAEPPGAQRQPNLPNPHTRYVLLLRVVPNLQYQPTGHVLLLSVSRPNLPNTPTGHVLLLDLSQPNLANQHTRHVLLLSTVPNLQYQHTGHVLLVLLALAVLGNGQGAIERILA
jgi:hypothetical protein